MPSKEQAQNFGDAVTLALRANRRARRKPGSITELAGEIACARETVSRALNQNEFPEVRARIARCLGLTDPVAS